MARRGGRRGPRHPAVDRRRRRPEPRRRTEAEPGVSERRRSRAPAPSRRARRRARRPPSGRRRPRPRRAVAAPRGPYSAGRSSSRKPVRGGQIVYAQNNDLVVLAPGQPGRAGDRRRARAHLRAAARPRGRGRAGACRARASSARSWRPSWSRSPGAYVMADEIPPERRGSPAQIYLEDGECRIAAL